MNDTDTVLVGLRADWSAAHAQAKTIIDNPASSAPELVKAEKLFDRADALGVQITERKATLDHIESLKGRHSAGDTWASQPQRGLPFNGAQGGDKSGRIETGLSEIDKRRMDGGFKSIGHFTWSQVKSGRDNRGEPSAVLAMKDWHDLQLKAPTGMFEVSDTDGGTLVPPQFSNNIYERIVATNQILSYLSPIPITGNQMTFNAVKQDSRADGLRGGGTLGYWDGEANQYTNSHAQLRKVETRLHKLTVMTPVTDELMNDSPVAMGTFVSKMAVNEINFKVNDALVNGNGNGIPLGVHNANCKITVTAVSGQGNNTFVYANVLAMYARVTAGQRGSLIWLYNQDVEPQLLSLYMATGTAAGVAVFTPNAQSTGFNLQGRPALVIEQCQSLGTAGDVIAFATDGYVSITKGSIESFMSLHLRFDYDEQVFKWRFRLDAQPYDDVALTPYKGSNTTSSIVELSSTRT
jgi:HK97 family phage major capsid protein